MYASLYPALLVVLSCPFAAFSLPPSACAAQVPPPIWPIIVGAVVGGVFIIGLSAVLVRLLRSGKRFSGFKLVPTHVGATQPYDADGGADSVVDIDDMKPPAPPAAKAPSVRSLHPSRMSVRSEVSATSRRSRRSVTSKRSKASVIPAPIVTVLSPQAAPIVDTAWFEPDDTPQALALEAPQEDVVFAFSVPAAGGAGAAAPEVLLGEVSHLPPRPIVLGKSTSRTLAPPLPQPRASIPVTAGYDVEDTSDHSVDTDVEGAAVAVAGAIAQMSRPRASVAASSRRSSRVSMPGVVDDDDDDEGGYDVDM